MNWMNLLWIFYFAVHTAAGVFYLVLLMVIYGIQEAGPWAWTVPVGCLLLLMLDLTGRLSLRGSVAKTLAALLLPLLCSCVEVLLWDDQVLEYATPAALAWVFSQLLLAAYALLREETAEVLPDRAEVLLARGSALGVVEAVWLTAAAGAVLFMSTFGLLVSLFIGGLIAARNSLLDYGGMKGLFAGLLVLYVLQCLWFWRGLQLAKKRIPDRIKHWSPLLLWIPIVNLVWADRLRSRLWNNRMEEENHLWAQL